MSRIIPIRLLIILALIGSAVQFSPAKAETLFPAGFVSESVVPSLTGPTTIAFAPDGRMFIGQKDGRVRVFQNGVLLPTDFIDISSKVNNFWDRGLLGIAIHPDFPNTPYVYLYFTYDPPGTTDNGNGARVIRLLRVTANSANTNVALAGSEVVILGTNSTLANIGDLTSHEGVPSCESSGVYVQDCVAADGESHTGGTITFGTDGSLFVSIGDAANFNYVDYRALRALNLDSLNGKILRINPITGEGYPDNPFYNGNPDSNRSKVYSYGLRNPFRATVDPLTGELFIGDVGWGDWEEINKGRGKNFGWPCYEGNDVGSAEQGGYRDHSSTSAACAALYAQGDDAVEAPVYSYQNIGGASVQVGGFYQGTVYPSQYQGALFFSDYDSDWIRYLTFDVNGNATAFDFGTDVAPVGGLVQLLVGPDTNLYYVAYNGPIPNTSEVRRILYTAGGNTPPTAYASAETDSGLLPFTVNFSSAGSFDPDGQALTYAWDFGDGGTSTDPNPSYEYTVAGNYEVTLTITDSETATGSDTLDISAGNLRPVATITSPAEGFAYSTGTTITYTGTGVDNEDGNLSGAELQWDILLHHNNHVHFDFIPGLTGNSGNFQVPDHGDNTWIELCLTVTDSNNLTDQDCVNLDPKTVNLTFNTAPSGMELSFGGSTYTTPFTITTNVNSVRDLIAPATQGCATFTSWSDGKPATHQITTPAIPKTYTATYTPCLITASASSGGTITPSGTTVIITNTSQSFNIAPNSSFILSDVLVDGVSVGRANSYTFDSITSSHTIAASFNGGWSAPAASAVVGSVVANPNNSFSSNNSRVTFDSGLDSVNYTSFGINNIPSGAVVSGIEVAVEGYTTEAIGGRNVQIQLSWDGGSNFTTVTPERTSNLPTTDGTVILGGTSYKWGRTTWINSEFSNANFVLKATSASGGPSPVYIDQFQVKVSYVIPVIPPKSVLRSPASNTVTNDDMPTFWWTNVASGDTYEIMFATDPAFTNDVESEIVDESPYTVITPFNDGLYYWRVRAYNIGNQSGAWSSPRRFTVDTTAPPVPVLVSPVNASSSKGTPTFRWQSASAVLYEFQYDNDANCLSPNYTVTTRSNFRKPPAMQKGTYYWCVRAKDSAGNWSNWSTPSTITIGP